MNAGLTGILPAGLYVFTFAQTPVPLTSYSTHHTTKTVFYTLSEARHVST